MSVGGGGGGESHTHTHARTRTIVMGDEDLGPPLRAVLRYDPLVVIWIYTDTVTLEVKRILTELGVSQLILVQVRPAPDTSIDHVREAFPTSNLQRRSHISLTKY